MKRAGFIFVGAAVTLMVAVSIVNGGLVTNSNTEFSSAWNNGKKMVKYGDKLYAVVMTDLNGTDDIKLYFSTDNGANWIEDPFFHGQLQPSPRHPSIALESNGNPHVAYIAGDGANPREVWHQWFDGSIWQEELVASAFCLPSLDLFFTPSIVVEPAGSDPDTTHIVWVHDDPICAAQPVSELFYWNNRQRAVETIISWSGLPERFQFPSIAYEWDGVGKEFVIFQDNYSGLTPYPQVFHRKRRSAGIWDPDCSGPLCDLVSYWPDGGQHPSLDLGTNALRALHAVWDSPINNGVYHDLFLDCGGSRQWKRFCRASGQPLTIYDQGTENEYPVFNGNFALWRHYDSGSDNIDDIWYARYRNEFDCPPEAWIDQNTFAFTPGDVSNYPHLVVSPSGVIPPIRLDGIWTDGRVVSPPWEVLSGSRLFEELPLCSPPIPPEMGNSLSTHSNTEITYQVPHEGNLPVSIRVYDTTGRIIRELVNENQPAGFYGIGWDKRDEKGMEVPSGVYFYHLQIGGRVETKRTFVIR